MNIIAPDTKGGPKVAPVTPTIPADADPRFCRQLGVCGGCAWGERALDTQRADKISALRALGFADVAFADTPALGLRDRVDLVWENGKLGLYHRELREIVDLPECPMLSPPLEAFLRAYRERRPPIQKGSVRLRVAPDGARGVWLDFANVDVKTLFEERAYLRWLSDLAFVEIGQKRKALTWRDDQPKLTDPVLAPWFETYDADMKPIPLFGAVGGFSQAGFTANRALVQAVTAAVGRTSLDAWVELFCGNGNFALALAARGYAVEASELDPLALEGLERSRAGHPEWNLRVERADAYLKTRTLPPLAGKGLLVDPPRAGLRQVLDWIAAGEKPSAIVYVSCFTEVFVDEAQRLRELGYELRALSGVDQFAHSPHTEWIALFTIANS